MMGFTKEELIAELTKNLIGAACGTVATLVVEKALPKIGHAVADKVKEIKFRRNMKLETFDTVVDDNQVRFYLF